MSVKNKKPKKNAPKKKPQLKHRPIWEEILEIMADVPEEELEKFPSDLSARHEYYLYGTED